MAWPSFKTLFSRRPALPALRVRRDDWASGGLSGGGLFLDAGSPRRPWGSPLAEAGGITNSTVPIGFLLARRRSEAAYLNDPHFKAGVDSIVSYTIGNGVTPSSGVADEAIRQTIAERWSIFVGNCDDDDVTNLYGFQANVMRSVVVEGEAVVHFTPDGGVRLLKPSQLDFYLSRELPDGNRIANGVELNSRGHRVAYWILPDIGPLSLAVGPPVRVDAADIAHVFRPITPYQIRGIPWGVSVLLDLNEQSQLRDALLVGAKVSAMMCAFILDLQGTGPNPFADSSQGTQKGSIFETGLSSGTAFTLPSGYDVKFSQPASVQNGIELAKLGLRGIASGLGVPTFMIDSDLSQFNYSSIRSGMVDFRRKIETYQNHMLIPQFLNPLWRRWLTTSVLSSAIDIPNFERDPESYLRVSWLADPLPWVDPLKDIEAEAAEIACGLKSRKRAAAERGLDVVQLDREIAADHAREAALGLSFSVNVPPKPIQGEA